MSRRLKRPFVSIVIPVFNEEKNIGECLTSVLALDWPRDRLEILLIDNGSTDSTLIIAEQILLNDCRARLFCKEGGTIASVRNYGWRQSCGEILAFLDGDSVVGKNWLKIGVDLLQSSYDISCVGFAVTPPSVDDTWIERTWWPISSSGKHSGTKEVPWLSSFNLILWREAFENVNGFDETLVTCEDADLGARLSKDSRLIFSDLTYVQHLGTVKTVTDFLRKEFWRGKNSFDVWWRSGHKKKGFLSLFIPVFYTFVASGATITAAVIPLTGISSILSSFVIFIFLTLTLPLMLALRAGVWRPRSLLSTSVLFSFYLLARGAAIVCFNRK